MGRSAERKRKIAQRMNITTGMDLFILKLFFVAVHTLLKLKLVILKILSVKILCGIFQLQARKSLQVKEAHFRSIRFVFRGQERLFL